MFRYSFADASFTRLTNPPAPWYDARPNISPDGKMIVFNRQMDGEKNTIGIYVLDL
jgi:Tol biopolymer transport system component